MTTPTTITSGSAAAAPAAYPANATAPINLSCLPGGQISAALIGDSITAKNQQNGSVSAVTWQGNSASFTTGLAHGLIVGTQVRYVSNSGGISVAINGVYTVTSITSTTTFTATSTSCSGGGTDTGGGTWSDLQKIANTGWMSWANAFSGQRFNIVWNAGKGGDTAAGMATRFATDILSLNPLPQMVFIMGGVNDTGAATAGTTLTVAQTIATNLLSICTAAIKAGIVPVLMTVLPVGSGLGSASVRQACINQLNNILRYSAGSNSGIVLIDTASAVMNPATGFMNATCLSSDGSNIHLGPIGAQCVGQMVADFFGKARSSYLLTSSALDNYTSNNNSQNVLDNAPWVATGGTVGTGGSGTAAQGFNVLRTAGTGTFVSSVPARTLVDDGDTIGFNQRLAITSGGATDSFDARIILGTDTAMQNRMVVGGYYELRCALRLQNVQGSGLRNFNASFAINQTDAISGFAYSYSWQVMNATESTAYDQAFPIAYRTTGDMLLTLRAPAVQVPAAITGSNGTGVRFVFAFAAAATAGNPPLIVDIGRVSFVRVA